MNYEYLKNNFFMMIGPNVIESEEHCLFMAKEIKKIMDLYNIPFYFKTSFDKANRTSLKSYRGVSMEEGIKILKKVKDLTGVKIITDIHESWQAKPVAEVADILQIPAFLCRQTDLLVAAAKTGKIIHIKKGQFCSADVMHKSTEKVIEAGNNQVILCERGNMFGYQDLVVDPRNLIWLRSNKNLVSMDITHCLQQPAQKMADGTVRAGGLREMIPYMGRMAVALGVNGIFMEVHDRPDESLCDAPTQWPLDRLEWLLQYMLGINNNYLIDYKSSTTNTKAVLGTIEQDVSGFNGNFNKENVRGERILDMFLKENFSTVLDIGAGEMIHSKIMIENGKVVDTCDYGNSVYYGKKDNEVAIRKNYVGDFNDVEFDEQYDAIWCSHILEHQPNPNIFLKKVHKLLKDGGILGIVVPPRKPFIVGGHVSVWNAGLVLYHLVLAGFNCRKYCKILQYDYNIGIIIKKDTITNYPEDMSNDKGDIELLSDFFPFDVKHNFNGDIMEFNWH
ncbi:3-deoxy-8-phosphooctulonate synthase [Fadolivirus algeromassiliense]|jgi:2-dehydro-3-deoxyphosphooctonate aldolase (KDO 8-P synthase)|uniref:3-deoxy-8-phosphooctulonate synthase n=1 Tax=Fadolivirus FV1/VV64 TaxID=3070911 RepID=A0A7D3QWD4_9VIRU|nr:3-deoxy-8-phosphooctulonate synthase [Fadolivirus algeromassiliense]QKF94406.1 3-deoxy-8-phosphooctulonate synthase [Fadolivirus FV1/VV64]